MSVLRFLASAILAAVPAHASPEDPFVELDRRYSAYTDARGPGFAVTVTVSGTQRKAAAFGYSDPARETLNSARTSFDLASNSKAFTAALALLLEQDGVLSPEDPVSKWVPEFPEYARAVRLKHLIWHISGLPGYESICERSESGTGVTTNGDVIAFLRARDALEFPAGHPPDGELHYSNTGYVVLSEVIQRAARTSFPRLMAERIFDPLGMKRSRVFSLETERSIVDRAYGTGPWPWLETADRDSCNYVFGDGGVYTSIEDYQLWASAVADGALFKPRFREKVLTSGLTDEGRAVGYSYGWLIDHGPGEGVILSHSGAWGGFRSTALIVPGSKIWAVVLSNYVGVPLQEILGEYLGAALE